MDRIAPALRAAAPAGVSCRSPASSSSSPPAAAAAVPEHVRSRPLIGALGALTVLAVRLRLSDRDRAAADRDPVDPDQFPARARRSSRLISVNFLVEYLVALIGLGVAIDYSLLLMTRWREEREARALERGGDPRRGRHGRTRRRAERPDRRRRAAIAVRAAGAVPAQHRFRRHADPAGRDHGGGHPAARDPRRLGTRTRRRVRRSLDHVQSRLGAVGRARRAPPLDRRRRRAARSSLLARPGAVDEHRPAARELARRTRQPAKTLHASSARACRAPSCSRSRSSPTGARPRRGERPAIADQTPGVYTVLAPPTSPRSGQGRTAVSVIPRRGQHGGGHRHRRPVCAPR